MLSKVEIDILMHLKNEGLLDTMNSRTIKNVSQSIDLNYFRTRNNLYHLQLLGMVGLGFKEIRSNTYYLTQKGIDEIEKIG